MAGNTVVSIHANSFLLNGVPTYPGRSFRGMEIEGLLVNSRMVQAVFDDLNPETRGMWTYPDTGLWDPERNTREFVAGMPQWRERGLLAFTINLQGGCPVARFDDQPWHNSAWTAGGALRPDYEGRLRTVFDRADDLGMVVILGLFYFGQDERLAGEAEIRRAVESACGWVLQAGYANILIEINNECDVPRYEHEILQPHRVHELIALAKAVTHRGKRLLVGTSYGGGTVATENVVAASDLVLLHGNGVEDPERIEEMVRQTRALRSFRPMPILFNEDDHYGFDRPANNMLAAISEYASWGYYDQGDNNYQDGYQSPPVNWGINTQRKQEFLRLVGELAGQ
jgi:hypothetical protein